MVERALNINYQVIVYDIGIGLFYAVIMRVERDDDEIMLYFFRSSYYFFNYEL